MSNAARLAWVGAAATGVFAIWVATSGGSNTGVGFFYAIPIGLAAWWWGARAAAIAVAGSVVLYVIGSLIEPIPQFGLALAVRLVAFCAVAAIVSFLRERFLVLEHSAEELEAIRAALAPANLPELPDVDAAAAFVPSEFGVSGDFYLLTNGPDGSTVAIVGDVAGHGPAAAQLATFIRARFAAFAANTSDPAELLMLANGALVERSTRKKELVSAVCLRYSSKDESLAWAVAGHPPPLRIPHLDELEVTSETFLLGAADGLDLTNHEARLQGDDGVVVYTDGATDVRRRGDTLGLEGLARLLDPHCRLPARSVVSRVEKAILEWTDGPIRDDLCLLVLRPRQDSA